MIVLTKLAEAANTGGYFEIRPEEARELWSWILALMNRQPSEREPRLAQLLKDWLDMSLDEEHDMRKLAALSVRTRSALAAIAMDARVRGEGKLQRLDAARYRWLRDGNAYAPEEASIGGYEALDKLCDEGIAAAVDVVS